MPARVFVTGFGILSSIGIGPEETLCSLASKKSGIGRLQLFDSALKDIPVGEIHKSNSELAEMAGVALDEHHSRSFLLGLIAAKSAVAMAQCDTRVGNIGIVGSTTVAGQDLLEAHYEEMLGHKCHDLAMYQAFGCSGTTEYIALELGITHNISTISTACSSSANAIMNGVRMIRNGLADTMLVGGMDALSRFSLNGFNALEIL